MDLTPFLVGGAAARPDSLTGLNPRLVESMGAMFAAAPPEIRDTLRITSGYRSPEKQAELYAEALKKYGSPAAARKWVAPPGKSNHNHGTATDLKYMGDAAREWAHANAANYGLAFPLSNEPWHIELADARGGAAPAAGAPAAPRPDLTFGAAVPAVDTSPQGLASLFGPAPVMPPVAAPPDPGQRMLAQNEARAEEDRKRRTALFGGADALAALFL